VRLAPTALYKRSYSPLARLNKSLLFSRDGRWLARYSACSVKAVMKMNAQCVVVSETSSIISANQINHHIGWCLWLTALASAAWIAPWSLNQESRSVAASPGQTTALQAQTMIAVLGMLQLATSLLLRNYSLAAERNIAAWLTGWGSLLAGMGYLLSPGWSYAPWLIVIGAIMNLAVLMDLTKTPRARQSNRDLKIILTMLCFGMVLVATMALSQLQAEYFQFAVLGPDDGFTLRTLRLARVAAIALPVLSLLYHGVVDRADPSDRVAGWGRLGMICGTVGMATILVAAGVIFFNLKMLLVIPSVAIFVGVVCGFALARRHAAPLETWGWLLIALSMAAGLLMGVYAFASPWVTLEFPGEYNEYARRLIRLAHVDCVILGLVAIFVARENKPIRGWRQIGAPLLIVGSITTVGTPFLLLLTNYSSALLCIGPALITATILFCVASNSLSARITHGGSS
jgi:hypothetical protein